MKRVVVILLTVFGGMMLVLAFVVLLLANKVFPAYYRLAASPAGQAAWAIEEIQKNMPTLEEQERYCEPTLATEWNSTTLSAYPTVTHTVRMPGEKEGVPYTCEASAYRCGADAPPEISVSIWGMSPSGKRIIIGSAVKSSC